jgi:hypothetical protein
MLKHLFQFDGVDGDAISVILQGIRNSEFVGDKDQLPVVLFEHDVVGLWDYDVAMSLVQRSGRENSSTL